MKELNSFTVIKYKGELKTRTFRLHNSNSERYSETWQTSKVQGFAKKTSFQSLTIFARSSILDVCQSSKYTSDAWIKPGKGGVG